MTVFPDDRIGEHLADLRAAEYPSDRTSRLVDLLIRYASSLAAEDALSEAVDHADAAAINYLLLEHVFPDYKVLPNAPAWIDRDGNVIAAQLVTLGFGVVSSIAEGWVITTPSGERLARQYRSSGDVDLSGALRGRDETMARLAVLAVGIHRIRSRANEAADTEA